MAWFLLVVARLMEIAWAIGLKYTEGFTRLVPSVLTLMSMAASMALLGIWLFDEPATVMRLLCIGLIVSGIVGLKLVT
jgi:quaternary ammonium compound-resistance protein SugE